MEAAGDDDNVPESADVDAPARGEVCSAFVLVLLDLELILETAPVIVLLSAVRRDGRFFGLSDFGGPPSRRRCWKGQMRLSVRKS